jgi:FAD/FMN-containing dehydrogenase
VAGAGTGVTGGRVAFGGVVVAMERFRKMEIGTGSATVGAGVLLKELQSAAAQTGQFYAPDPTEFSASIGGTIATNASGSRSFFYGDTRRHILGLRVALMDGRIWICVADSRLTSTLRSVPRPATTKHTAGFPLHPGMDMLDLFIGSEGTLGVVTEAVVQLLPIPEELLSGVVFFASDEDALTAVDQWRALPGLRMLEYIDAPSLDLLRPSYSDIPRSARAALLIEQQIEDESEYEAWEQRLAQTQALAEASWFAASDVDRERFRRFRHALPEAVNDLVRRRGVLKMNTDFAVPFERNREMISIYRSTLEREFPGQYVIFGHIGDAHVHVNILPASEKTRSARKRLSLSSPGRPRSSAGRCPPSMGLGNEKLICSHSNTQRKRSRQCER